MLYGFSCCFGAFAGSVVALVGPILVEQFGMRNLPLAFGVTAGVQGPAVVLGPNPQPSTLNPQPSTLNPQPSTLNPKL